MKLIIRLLKRLLGLLLKGVYCLGFILFYLLSYILGPLTFFVIGCFLYSLFTATWIHVFLLGGILLTGVIAFLVFTQVMFKIEDCANYLLE